MSKNLPRHLKHRGSNSSFVAGTSNPIFWTKTYLSKGNGPPAANSVQIPLNNKIWHNKNSAAQQERGEINNKSNRFLPVIFYFRQ